MRPPRGLRAQGLPRGRPGPLHPAPSATGAPATTSWRLRAFLRDFSLRRPRWGWRRAARAARDAGWRVNHKRIHRLWRGRRPACALSASARSPLRGIGVAVGAFCPIRPNVVWALDFQFDQTADGRTLKLLNVIDEFTRECLAIDVERSIDADGVVACLERLAAERGAPAYVRFDHGPEFIAYAVADWCRFNGTGTVFIDPGSPWQNAWIEIVQRPPTRRAPQRPALRLPARGQGLHRGLAHRLQHQQAPQRARLAHPGRVRRGLAPPTTLTLA